MTAEERRKRDEEAIFAAFALLLRDTDQTLRETVDKYNAGGMSAAQLTDAITVTLTGAHTQATVLGRRLAGINDPLHPTDQQFAAVVMLGQVAYIRGLVQAIVSGEYPFEDGEMPADLLARLGLHAKRVRGTANEAWAVALAPTTLINWVLGPNANHCESCPEYAAGSPYAANALPTTPGSADCICLSACMCSLVTLDGRQAFPPMEKV